MTIATKPLDSKEDEKKEIVEGKGLPIIEDGTCAENFYGPPPVPLNVYLARRRRRMLLSLCVGLLGLWFLVVAIIGGMLLYRYVHRKPIIHGWCGADLLENGHRERLQQRIEVDQEYEYERVEVPKFGANRPAVFVHDFKQNLTAIIDIRGRQCFIKPLDRGMVPPKSFVDLLHKMEEGYYEQDTSVVEQHYLARHPPLNQDELKDLGSFMIRDHCGRFASYWLQRITALESRKKRAACEKAVDDNVGFVEFVPKQAVYKMSVEFPCTKD